MGLEVFGVGGAAGHDHFEGTGVIVFSIPAGTQAHQFFVEGDADAAAHADDHALAVHGGEAVLEVLHDILGHQR